MSFGLGLIAAIVGHDRLERWFIRQNRPAKAWEVSFLRTFKCVREDPTWIYTFEFAAEEVERAKLAMTAQAPEWGWINAESALIVLNWKGAMDDPLAEAARELKRCAQAKLDPLRLEDLTTYSAKTTTAYTRDVHSRRKTFRSNDLVRWRRSVRLPRYHKLTDRPLGDYFGW